MEISSSKFENNTLIPSIYTCEGKDISPPINWSGIPAMTKSLALIVDDPDAPDPKDPKMTFVHWIVYNLPVTINNLPEDFTNSDLKNNVAEGVNDWKRIGYGGPCPPIGKHRYFFKLYALDTVLTNLENPTKDDLEKAMANHIIEKAELVGYYQKQK